MLEGNILRSRTFKYDLRYITSWGSADTNTLKRLKSLVKRAIKLVGFQNGNREILDFDMSYKYFVLMKMHFIVIRKEDRILIIVL